jgi:hypothetical protein
MSTVEQTPRTTTTVIGAGKPTPAPAIVAVAQRTSARPVETRSLKADPLSSNPVARAHARGATATESHWISGVLLWTVVIPTLVFLVSNPLGWIVLFMLVLAGALLTAFAAIF